MIQRFKEIFAKYIVLFVIGFAVLFLAGVYVTGCKHGQKMVHCPEVKTNTVYIHDTVFHKILDRYPYYVYKTDTIFAPTFYPLKVDTVFILKDYFATHVVKRNWQDSLITVSLTDYISENKPSKNDFQYKILRPQTIINNSVDNSVHYNKYFYLYGEMPVDIKTVRLGGLFAFRQGLISVSYDIGLKTVNLGFGYKILEMK